MNKQKNIIAILRYTMGFIFLWAFFDKTFGLGFATLSEKAWVNGGSPTFSFLSFGARGPFAEIFHSMAGVTIVDWLFMIGILFVGLTFVFNKFVKLGSIVGSIIFFLMYLALLLPENNPIIDEHVVYILVLIIIALNNDKKELA